MSIGYKSFHESSVRDPKGFWSEQAKLIDWHKPFAQVLDYSKPPFANGLLVVKLIYVITRLIDISRTAPSKPH